MLQPHAIAADGALAGAVVRLNPGYRFIAAEMKLNGLDGSIWPSLADIKRVAPRFYLGGRSRAGRP